MAKKMGISSLGLYSPKKHVMTNKNIPVLKILEKRRNQKQNNLFLVDKSNQNGDATEPSIGMTPICVIVKITFHETFFGQDKELAIKKKVGSKTCRNISYNLEFEKMYDWVKKKQTRAGVCKTLCPQLPDSNTV